MENQDISHSGFNFYWPSRTDNGKEMRVLMAVRKDILNRVFIKNCIDLVSYLYYSILDIKELHSLLGKVLQKISVANLYDNKVGRGQLWERPTTLVRDVIQDILWNLIIRDQVLILGDMNVHSPM